jgi:hypothetical protein
MRSRWELAVAVRVPGPGAAAVDLGEQPFDVG